MFRRPLQDQIVKSLEKKIVLLTGPRQAGKTTLARALFEGSSYLNFDAAEHRLRLKAKDWPRTVPLLVLDELHKMPNWKRWLKGVYDVEGLRPPLLVTGSARLDISRKMGDSLAGRYFQFRLHPLTIKELSQTNPEIPAAEAFRRLLTFGGFPEPFIEADQTFLLQWQRSHLDIILRQDLLDLENVRDISSIETLIELLRSRVGAQVSNESLARDLERSATTVKRWLTILENLYVIFSVPSYAAKIPRSLRKSRKYYFYDCSRVSNGEAARFENLIACALRAQCDWLYDCGGTRAALYFLRTKEGREIDFMVDLGERVVLIETKWSDDAPSPHFRHFIPRFSNASALQLVAEPKEERELLAGPRIVSAVKWLETMPELDGKV